MNVYDWEGTAEHKRVYHKGFADRDDVHAAVAEAFGVTREEAKRANFRLNYSGKPLAAAEGAQQNETDGAAQAAAERADLDARGTITVAEVMAGYGLRNGECLVSDLHHSLHRGERCPECGYCFEEIG